MVNDVRRAYFYAKASRDIYIELPAEDTDGNKDMLGSSEARDIRAFITIQGKG